MWSCMSGEGVRCEQRDNRSSQLTPGVAGSAHILSKPPSGTLACEAAGLDYKSLAEKRSEIDTPTSHNVSLRTSIVS